MKRLLKLIAILLFPCFLFSQERFDFEFDYAQFAYDSSSNYVELYYSFGQASMIQVSSDTSFLLEGILNVEIRDSITKEEHFNRKWRISHEIFDRPDRDKSLVGLIGFILPKGKYECTISGKDSLNSSFGKVLTEYFNVEPFAGNNISVSDVQLASGIHQDSPNKNSVFYKNSYEVIPLPTAIFGESQPVLFHYFELYNLKKIEHENPVKLITMVLNGKGNIVFNKSKFITSSYDSRVEVGSVVLTKFPTDTYTLIITLIDSIGNYGVSSSKKFYVYNPSVEPEETLAGDITGAFSTSFGVMSEEELDDLFDKSKYIASSSELDQYKKINTLDGKREFLFQFWKARDNNSLTAQNEFFNEYMERVRISDQRYGGSIGKKGWKTDRGRIFIVYGEPSEIERYPNQIDSKPYEIWHYNDLEGGVIFVFADITNFSEYQLIHSTARGELRDDSWFRRIRSI